MGKKDPATDTLHGMEVSDPYRWLEDSDDPEVHEWTEDQNARSLLIITRQLIFLLQNMLTVGISIWSANKTRISMYCT